MDRAPLRELAGAFPSGVTIVTTSDADGMPRGLTCGGVVDDPPLRYDRRTYAGWPEKEPAPPAR